MDYVRFGEALCYARPVGSGTLTITAEAIHQERTGVHARLYLAYQGVTLAWSTFNIERDEDRVRLANSAHKHLNGQVTEYPAVYLKKDLDLFCQGLWAASLGDMASTLMAGAEAAPPEFVLMPYIVEEGGTIIFAKPGRGKSFVELLWAVSIDAGDEIPPERQLWQVHQQPVLFINLERGARSMARRLGRVNTALGLPEERPLRMMNQRGKSLADVIEMARREVREYGIGHAALDSISRAGAGDLNENQPVNKIIDMMNGLAPSWSGIGHAPRGSDEHIFGSIHFDAGADIVVRVTAEERGDRLLGVGLQITKANDVPKPPMETLALAFSDGGLSEVRRAEAGEFPEVEESQTGQGPSVREQVWAHMRALGIGASATEVSRELGISRDRVAKEFNDTTRYGKFARKGAAVLYGIVANGEA